MDPTVGVLVMAYGTPSHPDEVEAYYTDIRRGRPPSPEQLADLQRRYDAIGGLSPLAEATETQRAGLEAALEARAPGRFDVVVGFKHARPSIEEAVHALAGRGVTSIVALVLAPHYSALSVGEYLARAMTEGRALDVSVTGIRSWHLEPSYLDLLAAEVRAGLADVPPPAHVVFTAHSLPERILRDGDPYPEQLRATAQAVAERAGLGRPGGPAWSVAWQSAGRTPEPWLGPDVLEVISELAAAYTCSGVLVCACGFVSDHLEVLYDLDIQARQRAEALGLSFGRTASVGADPGVLGALADLVVAQAPGPRPPAAV
jgi:ferrochelatase